MSAQPSSKNSILKKIIISSLIVICFFTSSASPQAPAPDTVKTGIYITSIHDIDFKQKEYTVNFWLWLKYTNPEFDFVQNLEFPAAKSVIKSFSTIDTTGGKIYILMKLQCVMKDSWAIDNFPFDKQKLRIFMENSQFDSRSLVFAADTLGKHFDARFTLRGWNIDSFNISVGTKAYETAFGDPTIDKPHTEYSSFRVRIGLNRDAMELFWKMFVGMYVAFLIAYTCFYIHADSIDSRFGLSVGSLFAVIGNKYIIDSSLPESTTYTLVDSLHGITLFFILSVIASTAWSLRLMKKNKLKEANRFDMIMAQVLLVAYVALNSYYISKAIHG
jgi:hypothetical protein